jgi:hypothetical protein
MPSQVKIVDLKDEKSDDTGNAKSSSSRSSSSRSSSSSARKKAATDNELKSRLTGVFDRIAEAADARGDEELADIIREDRDVMAGGIVSLTRPFMALRAPVVLALAIVEPVMAFGRLARLMIGRAMVNRAERKAQPDDIDVTPH